MSSEKAHLLIVEARFYDAMSDALLDGAKSAIEDAGATCDVVTVPGALEVPAAIAFACNGRTRYDGYVALGMVIRGETYHFELVCNESARGLTDLAITHNLAIGNGIMTVENEEQGWARADKTRKDKGGAAAKAALAMIALRAELGVS
ncbi:MAG: 6,7-dimethyl-8-ribityllumazine synthase [Roseitalea sp.]|jgi:6,7-dimethyl-8-ribityllumazine synthase|nr:6,7-dimethyl-8-ribityllumazine synthase [Roseitalea sp.]MBO6722819.1 6,7-dimethyl-8-ribityllumazine synthase [Roseitalea sp.]MBO6743987.1 6,7-dimethyl-8-ribityllumazine synthase [Roseitalea sp.]